MRTRIFYLMIIMLIPVLFYIAFSGFKKTEGGINHTNANSTIPVSKDFTNFILNTSYRNNPCVWDPKNHFSKYKELNFNGVHMYDCGSNKPGQFDAPLNQTQINNVLGLIYRSDTKGLRSVFESTIIDRLCYGQRLEYEIVENTGDSLTNLGFCYRDRDINVASYTNDSGRTVLHSKSIPSAYPNTAGWICRDIYENMQQTDLYYFLQAPDTADWFLKPMMRINQTDFSASSNIPVVAIVTINFKCNTIDSTVIKVRNFKNSNDNYNGKYINTFNFIEELPGTDLTIPGSLDSNGTLEGLNYGNGGNSGVNGFERYNVQQCRVDFRVYWFGEVDVWFDKMTVDDKYANHLFDGTYDLKIKEETTHESFAELIFFMKKNNLIQPSNYLTLNYVLNKMENFINEKNIAQAK